MGGKSDMGPVFSHGRKTAYKIKPLTCTQRDSLLGLMSGLSTLWFILAMHAAGGNSYVIVNVNIFATSGNKLIPSPAVSWQHRSTQRHNRHNRVHLQVKGWWMWLRKSNSLISKSMPHLDLPQCIIVLPQQRLHMNTLVRSADKSMKRQNPNKFTPNTNKETANFEVP